MLTTKQYKILKQVSKKRMKCTELKCGRDSAYFYLLERNLIKEFNARVTRLDTFTVIDDENFPKEYLVLCCEITEEGALELLLCRQERYHFWIPTIISIIALLVSIFSIYAKPLIWTYAQEMLSHNVF